MTTVARCDYCERPYTGRRGCDYLDGDEKPITYGEELHPLSSSPRCRDCGTPKGREHHATCLATECAACHRQWHPGATCEEDAKITMPRSVA